MGRLTEHNLRARVISLGGKIEELRATITRREETIAHLRAENQRLVAANLSLRTIAGQKTARATFDNVREF